MVKERTGGATNHQEASVAEQRSMLRTRIRNWEQVRALYMPGLLQLRHDIERLNPDGSDDTRTQPENAKLWLPSSLPTAHRDAACIPGLALMEEKLRTAQCGDALESVRHVLRVKSRMVLFKNKNVRGQTYSTRSRSVIDRVHLRAKNNAVKYRIARAAKMALSGPGVWEDMFRPLLDSDIRSYSDPNKLQKGPGRRGTVEDEMLNANPEESPGGSAPDGTGINLLLEHRTRRDGTGESHRTLSWIWLTHIPTDEEANDDLLLSEWAKSRARAARSIEEVLLLREEMRRTMVFLEWKADWWKKERRTLRVTADAALNEGLVAYADEQANLQRRLRAHFQDGWRGPLDDSNNESTATHPPDHNEPITSGVGHEEGSTRRIGGGGGEENDEEEDDDDDDDDEEEQEEEEELHDVGDNEYAEAAEEEEEDWDQKDDEDEGDDDDDEDDDDDSDDDEG